MRTYASRFRITCRNGSFDWACLLCGRRSTNWPNEETTKCAARTHLSERCVMAQKQNQVSP